jgi:hypothetical protein
MVQQISRALEDDIQCHLVQHLMDLQLVVARCVQTQVRFGLEEQLVAVLFEQRMRVQHGDQTHDQLAHHGGFVLREAQTARQNGKQPVLEALLLKKHLTCLTIVVQQDDKVLRCATLVSVKGYAHRVHAH